MRRGTQRRLPLSGQHSGEEKTLRSLRFTSRTWWLRPNIKPEWTLKQNGKLSIYEAVYARQGKKRLKLEAEPALRSSSSVLMWGKQRQWNKALTFYLVSTLYLCPTRFLSSTSTSSRSSARLFFSLVAFGYERGRGRVIKKGIGQ